VTASSRALRIIAVPAMVAAGSMVAVQAEINGRLAVELGAGPRAGILAAVVSFGSGLILVAAITFGLPAGRIGTARLASALRERRLRPVEFIGGAFGAFLVATQGLTVGAIGVALFSIGVTAGQSASALWVDHVGMGPSGHQPLSPARLVAAVFAVAAVTMAAGERLAGTFGWDVVLLTLLPLLAGAGTSVQQALNGRLSAVGGSWATTLNNFVVGSIVLLLCLPLSFLMEGRLSPPPTNPVLYAGGAMGVAFIWLAATLVKVHGVLVLGLSMIAGHVIGAELIELTGPDPHVGIWGILGGLMTVLGVVIALWLRPKATVGISHM
jgi:transporter family-2 protein